jgi:hypothetical protein
LFINSNTTDNILGKVELVNNKARNDCLTKILLGIIKSKPVLFPAIADEIKSKAKKVLSKEEYKDFLSFSSLIFKLIAFILFAAR